MAAVRIETLKLPDYIGVNHTSTIFHCSST
jgi:hypothetical protein